MLFPVAQYLVSSVCALQELQFPQIYRPLQLYVGCVIRTVCSSIHHVERPVMSHTPLNHPSASCPDAYLLL